MCTSGDKRGCPVVPTISTGGFPLDKWIDKPFRCGKSKLGVSILGRDPASLRPSVSDAEPSHVFMSRSFMHTAQCRCKHRLGAPQVGPWQSDGGKWICTPMVQRRNCTVLSIGIDGNTQFEVGIFNRFGCEIHGFDHTVEPRCVAHLAPRTTWNACTRLTDLTRVPTLLFSHQLLVVVAVRLGASRPLAHARFHDLQIGRIGWTTTDLQPCTRRA